MYSILEFWPVYLILCAILFFVLRGVNLWYWKINDLKKDQEEQIRLLKKIAGEEPEDKSND